MKISQFLSFICWAFFTYISHFFAKHVLSLSPAESVLEQVICITSMQVGVGAILYVVLLFRNRYSSNLVMDYKVFLLGMFHTYGMLMTNGSMSQTTASLTHMVKMSEPFCTAILMAVLGKISFNFKILIIMSIILATAVASEPLSDAQSSMLGIFFALLSNLFFALRNIGTKYCNTDDSSSSKTTLEGFATISFGGFLSLIPLWIITCAFGFNNFSSFLADEEIQYALLASSFGHILYNIISITIILAIFNPVQHAMLNVAKRTSIVIVFYIFAQHHLSILNLVSATFCLVLSIASVQVFTSKNEPEQETKTNIWKFMVPGIVLLCLSFSPVSVAFNYLQGTQTNRVQEQTARDNWLQCIDDIQDRIIR